MLLSTVNGLCNFNAIPVPVVSDVHVSLDNCYVSGVYSYLNVKLPYITPALFDYCIEVDDSKL